MTQIGPRLSCDWMLVNSATAIYPTGNGGSTATAGSSKYDASSSLQLYGVLITVPVAAAQTLTIRDHAGTAIMTVRIGLTVSTSDPFPRYVPFGPEGIRLGTGLVSGRVGGLSATISGGAEAILFFA